MGQWNPKKNHPNMPSEVQPHRIAGARPDGIANHQGQSFLGTKEGLPQR